MPVIGKSPLDVEDEYISDEDDDEDDNDEDDDEDDIY
jgi:hypothetical protein